MEAENYSNIDIVLGANPIDFDVALASVDSVGTPGNLNSYVLKTLGYSKRVIRKIDLSEGYYLLNAKGKKSILFIVTIASGSTASDLRQNLSNALSHYTGAFNSKRVWVPLMGTGSGGLEFEESFNIISEVINSYRGEANFTISLPDDKLGQEFVKILDLVDLEPNPLHQKLIEEFTRKFNDHLFLVDSTWNGNDETERFIEQEIWEHGNNTKYLDLAKSIKKGDFLIMKSVIEQKGDNVLRLKAYGVVINNVVNNQKLEVEWIPIEPNIDNYGLDYYKSHIVQPYNLDTSILLSRLLERFPKFTNYLKDLNFIYEAQHASVQNIYKESLEFIKVVLNKAYDLSLVDNISDLHNVSTGSIDLVDEVKMAFVKRFDNKGLFFVEDGQDENSERERLMAEVFSSLTSDIDILKDRGYLEQYFAIFEHPFTPDDIALITDWSKQNNFGYHPIVLGIEDVFELAEKHGINRDDYISEAEESLNIPQNQSETISDKIPFHLDQVVNEDKLGRDPVAKAFVDLIKNDVFTSSLAHSFIVHLQGEWGTGKSSFMNLIRNHLNTDDEQWVIVEYNAWQNQHIKPPWWTLIDQVYRKSKGQLNYWPRTILKFKESFRRIWRYSGWEKILTFVVFVLGVFGIIYFGDSLLEIFKHSTEIVQEGQDISKKSTISKLSDFGKFILTLSSVIGTLYALAKILTTPFFINSSKQMESFVLKAADPMNKIKQHFGDLVDNINSEKPKRQLAIFIDDIDRCHKEFIVDLLEGIQTLFKEKRVLFIVAGDKNWITTSFGNIYKDFAQDESKQHQLGEFFLEKAFQLSFRMPNVSERAKELYWNHILGLDGVKEKSRKSLSDLSSEEQMVIKKRLSTTTENITTPEFMKTIEDDYNLTGDTASNLIIEEKNKDTEEIKHLLQDYYKLIDSNPRSIIRLANNYTMTRSVLIAERTTFDESKVFRWLIIEDLCPKVSSMITETFDVKTIETTLSKMKDTDKRDKCLKLLLDSDAETPKPLTIEDIKTIKGL